MTPRALDPESVAAKLEAMQRVLRDLGDLGEVDEERLRAEPIIRYAVERMLCIVVELAAAANGHLAAALLGLSPREYRSSFDMAAEAEVISEELARQLGPSTGLRDVLVHRYMEVDLAAVARSVPLALVRYPEYIRQVARFLQRQPSR